MTRRWVERLVALAIVAALVAVVGWLLLTIPLALAALAAVTLIYVRGRTVGYRLGRRTANRHWRELFADLGEDHGKELAQADATIRRLLAERNANYDAGFLAAMDAREVEP